MPQGFCCRALPHHCSDSLQPRLHNILNQFEHERVEQAAKQTAHEADRKQLACLKAEVQRTREQLAAMEQQQMAWSCGEAAWVSEKAELQRLISECNARDEEHAATVKGLEAQLCHANAATAAEREQRAADNRSSC